MSAPSLRCSLLEDDPVELVRRYLADPLTGWSVGTYGAIAEFQYDPDEPGLQLDLAAMTVRTERGALAIVSLAGVQPFGLTDDTGRLREIAWVPGGAVRNARRSPSCSTDDVGIAGTLHRWRRKTPSVPDDDGNLLAPARRPRPPSVCCRRPAGFAIARASPTRILASPVARIEVHQPIPPPGGRSPEGPHTHLLPKLLAQGHARPPGSPLPERPVLRAEPLPANQTLMERISVRLAGSPIAWRHP